MSDDSKLLANARLCHIIKTEHFDGLGFDLYGEKGKIGQFIGKVEVGSPAHAAGLRHGDRILQVNGESIGDKSHKEVVELIKRIPNETRLMVTGEPENNLTTTPQTRSSNGHVTNGTDKPQPEESEDASEKSSEKEEENGASLNLNMTAAELRARLAARKKFDPKKEAMDFKKKFDIIQKM